MIVVDASAILEVLLQTPAAQRVSRLLFAAGETLHAPHLIDLEIAQVLRRYVRSAGSSPLNGAPKPLRTSPDFPLTRYPHSILLTRIWQMRNRLTAYDAAYVALAEALDARLVTRDRALAKAGSRVQVEVISEQIAPTVPSRVFSGTGWRSGCGVGVEQELNRRLTTACGVYTEVVGYSPSSVSGAIRRNRSWFSRNALLVRAWPVASVSNA